MSTQNINPEIMPDFGTSVQVARIVRIINRPIKENDFWCDFEWENADGTREARCMQITHAQIDYMGYVIEEMVDDFAPEGITLSRGYVVEYGKAQNELIDYELCCIIMHFQDCHEPSNVFVCQKIVGKRKNVKWQKVHRYKSFFFKKSLDKVRANDIQRKRMLDIRFRSRKRHSDFWQYVRKKLHFFIRRRDIKKADIYLEKLNRNKALVVIFSKI